MALFFLIGDDVITKHDAFTRFLASHDRDYEYDSLCEGDLKNSNVREFLDNFFLTQDLFKNKKILLVKRLEEFDKETRGLVFAAANKASEAHYVFFEFNVAPKDAHDVLESWHFSRGYKINEYAIPKIGKHSNFVAWIVKRFSSSGKKCPPSLASSIAERFQDYHAIANAVSVMLINLGAKTEVHAGDVELLTGRHIESNTHELVRALLRKDLKRSFYSLAGIRKYDEQDVFKLIIGRITSEFKKLYGGRSFFPARFSKSEIPAALTLIRDADYAVKHRRSRPDRALELLITRLCRSAAPHAPLY